MTSLEIFSLIKTITTIFSLCFGILTWLKSQRLKQMVNANLWSLFVKQQNNYSMTQWIIREYKLRHKDNIDPEIVEWSAKAECYDQNIFEDIMNHIYDADNKLTLEKIDRYVSENKISHYDKKLFEMMINEPKNLSFIQRQCKKLGIPF